MPPGDQLDYWNRIGPGKTFSHPLNLSRITTLLSTDARILDFGCGYGRVLSELQEQGFTDLVGVDPAGAMISAARERHAGIAFEPLINPPHLPFADASFDAVLMFAVLTCVPRDQDQRAILRELHRVLRAGGLLHISDFWLQSDARNAQRYSAGQAKYGQYGVFDLPEGVTLRHHDRKWIHELTSDFNTVVLDEIQVVTMNGHPADGFQWYGRKAETGS